MRLAPFAGFVVTAALAAAAAQAADTFDVRLVATAGAAARVVPVTSFEAAPSGTGVSHAGGVWATAAVPFVDDVVQKRTFSRMTFETSDGRATRASTSLSNARLSRLFVHYDATSGAPSLRFDSDWTASAVETKGAAAATPASKEVVSPPSDFDYATAYISTRLSSGGATAPVPLARVAKVEITIGDNVGTTSRDVVHATLTLEHTALPASATGAPPPAASAPRNDIDIHLHRRGATGALDDRYVFSLGSVVRTAPNTTTTIKGKAYDVLVYEGLRASATDGPAPSNAGSTVTYDMATAPKN